MEEKDGFTTNGPGALDMHRPKNKPKPKLNSKWIPQLNGKRKNTKHLGNVPDQGLGAWVLDLTPEARHIRGKSDELDIIKIKNLEDQIKRMKEEDQINWSLVRQEYKLQESMSLVEEQAKCRTQRRGRLISAKGI